MGITSTLKDVGKAVATGGLSLVSDVAGEVTGAGEVSAAAETQAAATLTAAREAEALNRERYGEAQAYMQPYLEGSETAYNQLLVEMGLAPGEAGTGYMETPGYEGQMEERQRQVTQAAAGSGTLYSGRRVQAAADVGGQVQSQFYNNYMSMLQNVGNPQAATNLAALGVGQAATMGQQNIQAQQAASGYIMGGAQANQAAQADLLGGIIGVGAGFI